MMLILQILLIMEQFLIRKLKIARQNNFIFFQINKLTRKVYSNLSNIRIHYYLKHRIPIMHRHFLENYLKIVIMFRHIVIAEIIQFILHVV